MTRTIVLNMPTGKLTLSGDDGVLIEAFGMLVKGADAGHMPVPVSPVEEFRAIGGTRVAQVVAAIRGGCSMFSEIHAALGATSAATSAALYQAKRRGLVVKVGISEYALPEGA